MHMNWWILLQLRFTAVLIQKKLKNTTNSMTTKFRPVHAYSHFTDIDTVQIHPTESTRVISPVPVQAR